MTLFYNLRLSGIDVDNLFYENLYFSGKYCGERIFTYVPLTKTVIKLIVHN